MNLVALNFDGMNEAGVREEFIAPLISSLGYKSGGESEASREVPLSLRYPRASLGRRKPKSDPYLRGRADYVLEVKGHARWVIEAKGADEILDEDNIEQAWSYANHPEVRAVYFALSNGREFRVYRTSAPPGSPPILQLAHEEVLADVEPISRLLSADAIRRAFPLTHQVGAPLGRGLSSLAKITGGAIDYSAMSLDLPILRELQISIVDGSIERGDEGNLIAYIVTRAPVKSIQKMIENMGFSKLEYVSTSSELSDDPSSPTEFVYSGQAVFKEGEELFDIASGQWIELPFTLRCDVNSRAVVYIQDGIVVGVIENWITYSEGLDFSMQMAGNISLSVL